MLRNLTFGVELGRHFDPERLAEDARDVERLGFDLLSVSDHLHTEVPTYDPWTALTWVAAATERIAVMPNVLGLPYRAPAVTAKVAETLARLSGGRLVAGIGTGGYDVEFDAFGLAVRPPAAKVEALGEALQIIRGLWTNDTFSFEGRHFRTSAARIEPKPSHPIPIWLGTYGPRALRLTGELADGWIPSLPRLGLSGAVERRTTVREAARAAGRDPDALTCACNVVVDFTGDGLPDSRILAGSDDAVAEQVLAIIEAGFTAPVLTFARPDDRARFASDVLPKVRAAR